MVVVYVEEKLFGLVYKKVYPTELQPYVSNSTDYIVNGLGLYRKFFCPFVSLIIIIFFHIQLSQHEFYAKVDALNKPLRTAGFNFIWIALAELIVSGSFFYLLYKELPNSTEEAEPELYLTMIAFLGTKLIVGYMAIICCVKVSRI